MNPVTYAQQMIAIRKLEELGQGPALRALQEGALTDQDLAPCGAIRDGRYELLETSNLVEVLARTFTLLGYVVETSARGEFTRMCVSEPEVYLE